MPKKDDDELVIPTELLEKDPTELANNEEEALSLALSVERHWNHTLIYEVKTNEVSEPAIVFDGGYEE